MNPSRKNSTRGIDLYTYGGNGNFGDDWIHSTGIDKFSELGVTPVKLIKSKSFLKTHRMKSENYGDPIENSISSNPVVLWGGGYLASDQSSHTLDLWNRILQNSTQSFFAFGLGVGPFNKGSEKLAYEVLSRLESPIYVRTKKDCELLANLGLEAELSCDVTLLDPGLSDQWSLANQEKVNNLVWLPPFAEHWRPFSSLDEYLSSVLTGQRLVSPETSTIFLDYENIGFNPFVKSDYDYWKHYFPKRITANSFLGVAENLLRAKSFVSGRLHPSLLALLLGTPLHLIRNHHKFDLILELTNSSLSNDESIDDSRLTLNTTSLQNVIERGNSTLQNFLEGVKSHV